MSNPFGDFLGCWKLLLLNFYGSLPRGEWLAGSFVLTSHTWIQMLQVYFIGTPPVSTADLCRPYKGIKEVRALDNGEAICWESESPKSSLNGTCLAGRNQEPRKSRSLRIWVFAVFWAFCWCLLLPSWFIWLLCITTDEKCHASSKSCHTYVKTSNQRPNHKRQIYQPAGRWGWIASIRVPWLQIVTEDWSFFFLCKVVE